MDKRKFMSLLHRVEKFYENMHERIAIDGNGDLYASYNQYLMLVAEAKEITGTIPPLASPKEVSGIYPIGMAQQLTMLTGQLETWLNEQYPE